MRIKKTGAALLLLAGLMFTATSGATVIISNLPATNDGTSSTVAASTGDFSKAAGFTMPTGADYSLDSATVRIGVNDTNASLTAQLFGDGGSGPTGPALVNFAIPGLVAGIQEIVLTSITDFVLQADSTYWLALTGSSQTSDGIVWYASSPGITPTGLASSAGYRFSNDGTYPPTGTSSTLNSYRIDGTRVPVPSVLALVGIGLLSLSLKRRIPIATT